MSEGEKKEKKGEDSKKEQEKPQQKIDYTQRLLDINNDISTINPDLSQLKIAEEETKQTPQQEQKIQKSPLQEPIEVNTSKFNYYGKSYRFEKNEQGVSRFEHHLNLKEQQKQPNNSRYYKEHIKKEFMTLEQQQQQYQQSQNPFYSQFERQGIVSQKVGDLEQKSYQQQWEPESVKIPVKNIQNNELKHQQMKQLYNPAEDNLPKTNIKALYKMKHEKIILEGQLQRDMIMSYNGRQ